MWCAYRQFIINYLTITSADFNIANFKVAIGVCVTVTVILLVALVIVISIWICGYSSWKPRGKRYTLYTH